MVKYLSVVKKQLTALFMLLVFLFIHGMKLFHTHDEGYPQDRKFHKEQLSAANDCDICDYHFTKDTWTRSSTFTFFKGPELPFYFNFYKSRSSRSIGLVYSDRGPPALI